MARAEAYLHAKFHLDPYNCLATIQQRHRQTDRQRSDSIGRTVLQTVAKKHNNYLLNIEQQSPTLYIHNSCAVGNILRYTCRPTVRDGHETSMAETETRPRRLAIPAETRPRRDVCSSRDVTETLKCTFIVTNAVPKQVNVVGLTTVAILSPRVRLFHGRYTARTWQCTRPSARSCTLSCTLL